MSSRNCPLKLQASIATQSQILLDLDITATQAMADTAPTAPTTQPIITAPTAAPILATAPTAPTAHPIITAPTAPKQLSTDRPEVLMHAYLAEKTAWLAQHPTIRPTEYCKARKWKNLRQRS